MMIELKDLSINDNNHYYYYNQNGSNNNNVNNEDDNINNNNDNNDNDKQQQHHDDHKMTCKKRLKHLFRSKNFHKILLILILFEWMMIIIELLIDLYVNGVIFLSLNKNKTINNIDLHSNDHDNNHHNNYIVWHQIKFFLQIFSLFIQTIFLFEYIIKMIIFGKSFFRKKHEIFDLTVIIISWTLSILFLKHKYLHYTSAIIFLRIWNVLRIIYGIIEAEHESEKIEETEMNSINDNLSESENDNLSDKSSNDNNYAEIKETRI